MPDYKVITDTSCDLSREVLTEYNIDIVPFYITFDGVNYFKEMVNIDSEEIYIKMRNEKAFPKTSLPTISDYMDKFKPYLEQGLGIICVCLTSKFSGSYQSAVNAANILKEAYPGRTISIINSENVTAFQGMQVVEIARMVALGYPLEKILKVSEMLVKNTKGFITVDTLEYLQAGGRIGKVSALAGNLFNIRPIILMENGELTPGGKVMGRKKALQEIVHLFFKDIGDKTEEYECVLAQADCYEDALEIKRQIEERGVTLSIPIAQVGCTIASHIGPSTIGLGYVKKAEYCL